MEKLPRNTYAIKQLQQLLFQYRHKPLKNCYWSYLKLHEQEFSEVYVLDKVFIYFQTEVLHYVKQIKSAAALVKAAVGISGIFSGIAQEYQDCT